MNMKLEQNSSVPELHGRDRMEEQIRKAQNDDLNVEYEKVIQKLEADVRTHIRVQQQLKLHIETLSQKIEDYERGQPPTTDSFLSVSF